MKILLFGGTTEGRQLAQRLRERDMDVTVCVATELGAEELRHIPGLSVRTGRLNQKEMEALLAEYSLCVDATHPYATEVSANIRGACAAVHTPLRRLKRPGSGHSGVIEVPDAKAAADYMRATAGNILLTTGAKELPSFSMLDPERIYARVLPTHDGISACEALGLRHSHILALQGPFSQSMNEAMLDQYHIRFLVTKDGGRAGGMEEKLAAARSRSVTVLLIARPQEEGQTMDALLAELEAMA